MKKTLYFYYILFCFVLPATYVYSQNPEWIVYNTSNSGLPDDIAWSIAIDSSGNKWIGTIEGGLDRFDGANWTVYDTSNSGLPPWLCLDDSDR